MNFNKSHKHIEPAMLCPNSDDLRWWAIWIKEFLGYSADDYPQYLSGLSRAFSRFFSDNFLKAAVYHIALIIPVDILLVQRREIAYCVRGCKVIKRENYKIA